MCYYYPLLLSVNTTNINYINTFKDKLKKSTLFIIKNNK